jgi:hypothetical protein
MFIYNSSFKASQLVLNCLEVISKKTYTVQAYQNCREQGHMLINSKYDLNKVAFICHHRNSDEIMVYIGKYSNQGLSDDAYNNGKHFNPEEYIEAARYIDEMIGEDEEV